MDAPPWRFPKAFAMGRKTASFDIQGGDLPIKNGNQRWKEKRSKTVRLRLILILGLNAGNGEWDKLALWLSA